MAETGRGKEDFSRQITLFRKGRGMDNASKNQSLLTDLGLMLGSGADKAELKERLDRGREEAVSQAMDEESTLKLLKEKNNDRQ